MNPNLEKILNIILHDNKLDDNSRLEVQEAIKILEDELSVIEVNLIRAEKMAIIGELTAGFAHEIQNPLNFVINFSELNKELISDLKSELNIGNIAGSKIIAHDIAMNEDKINDHGRRADSIIRGMLKLSRNSARTKELTDINELAEEYVRLAYHGLQAKDRSFNAEFKTDLDDTLPRVNIIPQDIGSVLLNLIYNAYFSVAEKAKLGIDGYVPTVILSTSQENGTLILNVKDNGQGIPADSQEKVFQPFFSTKPAGDLTGLGLSLTYEIITKVHRGELYLFSREGEGSEFILKLPFE
jgi:signal transduction histidine kinase